MKKIKLVSILKHDDKLYYLRIRKTAFKGIEIYYENDEKNWLFETWKNGDTLIKALEKWNEVFERKSTIEIIESETIEIVLF